MTLLYENILVSSQFIYFSFVITPLDLSVDPSSYMLSRTECFLPWFLCIWSYRISHSSLFKWIRFLHALYAINCYTIAVSKFSNFDKDCNWATSWWLSLKSTALVQSNKKYFQLETKQQTFYLLGQKMASVKLTWQNCCYCPTGELMKRKVENTHREHGPMQRDVSN